MFHWVHEKQALLKTVLTSPIIHFWPSYAMQYVVSLISFVCNPCKKADKNWKETGAQKDTRWQYCRLGETEECFTELTSYICLLLLTTKQLQFALNTVGIFAANLICSCSSNNNPFQYWKGHIPIIIPNKTPWQRILGTTKYVKTCYEIESRDLWRKKKNKTKQSKQKTSKPTPSQKKTHQRKPPQNPKPSNQKKVICSFYLKIIQPLYITLIKSNQTRSLDADITTTDIQQLNNKTVNSNNRSWPPYIQRV